MIPIRERAKKIRRAEGYMQRYRKYKGCEVGAQLGDRETNVAE